MKFFRQMIPELEAITDREEMADLHQVFVQEATPQVVKAVLGAYNRKIAVENLKCAGKALADIAKYVQEKEETTYLTDILAFLDDLAEKLEAGEI